MKNLKFLCISFFSYGGKKYLNLDTPGLWVNPFDYKKYGKEKAHELYKQFLLASPKLCKEIDTNMPKKKLGCWCTLSQSCHVDIIIEIYHSRKQNEN